MLTKNELRQKAKLIRSSLDIESISEKIVTSLRTVDIYQDARNIMIFYPLKDEINLLSLLMDGKSIYLPRVEENDLVVCPYRIGDELKESKFKTLEPISEPVNPDILDLIFVPAMMVDKNFYRLGYGAGFYDRFLSKNALDAIKIVPIPSELIIEKLPHDEFDIPFDIMVDEI